MKYGFPIIMHSFSGGMARSDANGAFVAAKCRVINHLSILRLKYFLVTHTTIWNR